MNNQENKLPNPPDEIPIPNEKRARDSRRLKWYERQYGAGFVAGLGVGLTLGLPIAAGVAVVCHYFIGWLTAL